MISLLKAKIEGLLNEGGADAAGAAKPEGRVRQTAVFDADGTLWREDVNDLLFRYQDKNGLRDLSDLKAPRFERESLRPLFCQKFAERQAGLSPSRLRRHIREALKKRPLSVFPQQRELLAFLRQRGVRIIVVTASLQEAAAAALQIEGLHADKIIGVKTEIRGGAFSPQFIPPLTYGEGKRKAFLIEEGGGEPLLASGNTMSDIPLMRSARLRLAVRSARKENRKVCLSEEKAFRIAKREGWFALHCAGEAGERGAAARCGALASRGASVSRGACQLLDFSQKSAPSRSS